MKAFRVIGAVFCVFGCIFALLGVISSILPLIENEQLQIIVNSFQEPSTDALTNMLNSWIVFCLHSGYFLLFCGISLTVAGGLISSSANKRQKTENSDFRKDSVSEQKMIENDMPKPAYYPGGLTPPILTMLSDDDDDDDDDENDLEQPRVQIISTMSGLTEQPISGVLSQLCLRMPVMHKN